MTSMHGMFYACSSFDSNIGAWETSSATNVSYMFARCVSFNQDLSGWNLSTLDSFPADTLVTSSESMFSGAAAFDLTRVPTALRGLHLTGRVAGDEDGDDDDY